MNAIEMLERIVREHRGRTDGRDALAKLETLLQTAETILEYGGALPARDYYLLDAAVRDVKGES